MVQILVCGDIRYASRPQGHTWLGLRQHGQERGARDCGEQLSPPGRQATTAILRRGRAHTAAVADLGPSLTLCWHPEQTGGARLLEGDLASVAVLEDDVADRLVLLRSLFKTARSRAQDPTKVGRHAGLVLLDGACELALAYVSDNLGVARRRNASLEDLYQALQAMLSPPGAIRGWSGVRLMHRARNSAQHDGILPDNAQLSRWIREVEQFLYDLVARAFGVS